MIRNKVSVRNHNHDNRCVRTVSTDTYQHTGTNILVHYVINLQIVLTVLQMKYSDNLCENQRSNNPHLPQK